MKLIDIATTVAQQPNQLFRVKGQTGAYLVTGFGERKVGGYRYSSSKIMKTVKVQYVSFIDEVLEGATDYFGNPLEAREASVHFGTVYEYLPSQIEWAITGSDYDEDGNHLRSYPLTTDNFLEHELNASHRKKRRAIKDKSDRQQAIEVLNNFLGDSLKVTDYELNYETGLRTLVKAIVKQLQKENN